MSLAGQLLKKLDEKRIIAYHGSPNSIQGGFRVRSNSTNSYGILGDQDVKRRGIFFSSSKKYAREFGDPQQYVLDISKMADLDKNQVRWSFVDSIDPHEERDLYLAARYSNLTWELFDDELGERFVQWLRSQGYDGARFREYQPTIRGEVTGYTYVVFSSNQVNKAGGPQQLRIPGVHDS